MLKKHILAILLIVIIFTLTSCDKVSYGKVSNDNATIQLWYYNDGISDTYFSSIMSLMANIRLFCDRNGIPLEIVTYDKKTFTYEEYIMKRNVAMANGNMIIIEDAEFIWDVSNHHADYTKLENYENLLDSYKDRFCIPLGVYYGAMDINQDLINYYDINIDKALITYDEYMEIKQKMKENGARFKMNLSEYSEKADYYIVKYGLKYVNETSEIFNDNDKFKDALKSTIIGTCDDIILYNDGQINLDEIYDEKLRKDYNIYDESSGLKLYDGSGGYSLFHYRSLVEIGESIIDKIIVVMPKTGFSSPCFYMYKNITNDRIYELANFIVSENSYVTISSDFNLFSPVFDGEKTRKVLELDENLKYNGSYRINAEKGKEMDIKICKVIDEAFEMLMKNKETSKRLANYYFIDRGYSNRINSFVLNSVSELSKENFDYKNEKVNKMIDYKIDEFIKNFNIHYN